MSSQFVDMNADGYNDIIAGSFSGTPQIIMGGKDGYEAPTDMLDGEGELILINQFWNEEDRKWDQTDRCDSKGQCTSVSAVDWDADGDLDLLLGDYDFGKLFLRINEGTAEEPKFATKNLPVQADGKPMQVTGQLAAPLVVDWNKDGKFDIILGAKKSGVFLYLNKGKKGNPEFGPAKMLIEPVDKSGSYVGKVPARNGLPTQPGSSLHVEAVDYDHDGDLDLLVGGRCEWQSKDVEKLSDEEQEKLDALTAEMKAVGKELSELMKEAGGDEDERKELVKSKEYKEVIGRYSKISRERRTLSGKADPKQSGDFVWLFRRK